MIAYLRGRVLSKLTDSIIIDVNGVGYEVFCSGSALNKIGNSDTAEVFTYLQVKEDGMTLYGFSSIQEKQLFLKLIGVSGVGPKMGIAVFSALSPDDFSKAIATADAKRLSTVKGLGKKTAEKIILELHGKISAAEIMSNDGGGVVTTVDTDNGKLSRDDEDAVSALMGFGYSRPECIRAVKKAHSMGANTTEEVIFMALRSGVN